MSSKRAIKSAFESMLFVWGEPLDVKIAAEVCNINWKDAYDYFIELQEEYIQENRGIRIREIDKCFQFVTNGDNGDYIERLCTPTKQKKLSQSALEVLAIVAYKQPVTKGEMESVRGIKCDRVIEGLIKKELIEEVGRSTAVGRPILYGTTAGFLRHFGISNLGELPEIEDIEDTLGGEDLLREQDTDQISIDQIQICLTDLNESDNERGKYEIE